MSGIKSVQINARGLWHYLAIFFFILFFYYFFTERLPWFWFDDVYFLKGIKNVTPLALLGKMLNFVSGGYLYRPTYEMFAKFCNLLFNEDPHYYRVTKVIILSVITCLMLYLTVKNGGDRFITMLNLSVFATLPSVIIANSWITDTETLELLFKVSSFVVFFALISEGEKKPSLRSIVFSVMLIIFIIFADRAKATAKIIPFIFLTYLLLIRHKGIFLYTITLISISIMLISILAVFPYAATSSNVNQSFYVNLFNTFLSQTWLLFVFVFLIGILVKDKGYLRDRYLFFSFLWLIYEILFYAIYPSNEMRYLFSSLAAAAVFLSILFSNILLVLTNESFKKIAKAGFVIVVSFILASNAYWSYNFRGSFAGYFVLVDKKMKFINQNFKDSLCIYVSSTLPYYAWETSNLYVNVNPNSSGGKMYDEIYSIKPHEIYSIEPRGIKILSPEKYEKIIALDESLVDPASLRPILFDSIIRGSLYDLFQGEMKFKLRNVNLYNISLGGYTNYPHRSGIYFVK